MVLSDFVACNELSLLFAGSLSAVSSADGLAVLTTHTESCGFQKSTRF